MTDTIDGKKISQFINDSLATIQKGSDEIKDLNSLIQQRKKNEYGGVRFNDAIDIYIFGLCLVNQMVKTKGDGLNAYWPIFYKINKYLYKKQCEAEKNFVNYTPHTKEAIQEILNTPEQEILDNPEQATVTKNEGQYKIPEQIIIPKLDENILTEPKLLKTSGLLNPDIATLIGDGKFPGVQTLKLERFSLKNQFIIRCRKSKIMPITCSTEKNINSVVDDLCKNLVDEKKKPLINYYYLFNFVADSQQITPFFLLNSICHVNFNEGYEDSLKKILSSTKIPRYIFTFGLFKSFKDSLVDFVGQQHRCALIFDTQKKKIYLYDTYLEQSIELYMFDNPDQPTNVYDSVNIACKHKFKNLDLFKDYTFFLKDIPMQHHDIFYKNLMVASTYYRYYSNHKTYLDWSGGYCGTQVLLLLMLMSMNENIELESILIFLNIISKSPIKNYQLLILLIRSFAFQIEQYAYENKTNIETQSFNLDNYVKTGGRIINIGEKNISLNPTDIPVEFEDVSLLEEIYSPQKLRIKRMLITEKNEAKIKADPDEILNKPISEVYAATSLFIDTISHLFKNIDRLQHKMTRNQRQWIFDHYGPDNLITFINF